MSWHDIVEEAGCGGRSQEGLGLGTEGGLGQPPYISGGVQCGLKIPTLPRLSYPLVGCSSVFQSLNITRNPIHIVLSAVAPDCIQVTALGNYKAS